MTVNDHILASEFLFAGATAVVIGDAAFPRSAPTAAIGGLVCVALRLMAIWKGWKLPVAQQPD